MCSYLKNHEQDVVINNGASTIKSVVPEVPQESLDGSLLSNIFTNDLVLFTQYTISSNYTDQRNITLSRSNEGNFKNSCFRTLKYQLNGFTIIISLNIGGATILL